MTSRYARRTAVPSLLLCLLMAPPVLCSALALGRPQQIPRNKSRSVPKGEGGGCSSKATALLSSRVSRVPQTQTVADNNNAAKEGMFQGLRRGWEQRTMPPLLRPPSSSRRRKATTRLHSSLYTRGGGGGGSGGGVGLIEQWEATERAELTKARRTRALLAGAAALTAAVAIDAAVGTGPSKRVAAAMFAALASALSALGSVSFWSAVAPYASICLKLSPMPTILGVIKKKDTGGLPLLPYTAMATVTFVLVAYGVLVRDPKIFLTHSTGHALSLFYCASFLRYYDPTSESNQGVSLPGTPRHHVILSSTIASIVTLSIILLKRNAAPLVGYSSALLAIVMYAGPLSAAKNAIANKSADSIPLPYALASLLNSISWSVYGYWGRDKDLAVWFPGSIGLVCAAVQVGINLLYGNGGGERPRAVKESSRIEPRELAKAA